MLMKTWIQFNGQGYSSLTGGKLFEEAAGERKEKSQDMP
jgi:hypothetical protein